MRRNWKDYGNSIKHPPLLLQLDLSPLTNGLPVVPALVVHPLSQQLDGRLRPVHLHSRHVEVVNEEDKVLAQRRTKNTLASVGQVERKEKRGRGRRNEGEGGRREVESPE